MVCAKRLTFLPICAIIYLSTDGRNDAVKRRFFDEAREESHLSDYDGQHLGAVAVYSDKFVLAKAHNTNRTNTTQWRYNRYRVNQRSNIMEKPARAHAEINLCRKIKYLDIDFSRVVVYIYRELRDGTLALAAPCAACERALRDLGIRDICYTVEGGYKAERFYPL